MKKTIAAAALTLFCAGFAFAAAGPATIELPAPKMGNVTFPHHKHQTLACTTCHATEKGGKIADLGKDWAHKTCKGCHAEKGKGPTKCSGCHKK